MAGLRLVDASFDLSRPYTLWAGILGGSFLAMASHGADQLIVQRLLACRGLRDAQRALIGSGVVVIAQFALFLTIGVALAAFFAGRPIDPSGLDPLAFHSSDEIFPAFIVRHLPPIASAYLVAGIFSAAMCSESSALNSLASALAHDIVAPVFGKQVLDGARGLWLGRLLTLVWTLVLAGLSVGFSRLGQGEPAVQVALGLASVTAGGLLGAFLIGLFLRRATAGRRAPRDRDLGCRDARAVARLEGVDPAPAGAPDRLAVVLASRLRDRVLGGRRLVDEAPRRVLAPGSLEVSSSADALGGGAAAKRAHDREGEKGGEDPHGRGRQDLGPRKSGELGGERRAHACAHRGQRLRGARPRAKEAAEERHDERRGQQRVEDAERADDVRQSDRDDARRGRRTRWRSRGQRSSRRASVAERSSTRR